VSSLPPRSSHPGHRSLWPAVVVSILALAGCGRQPLAPIRDTTVPAHPLARLAAGGDFGFEGEAVMTLAPGVDAAAFAAEVGALVVGFPEEGLARLAPVPPETPAALAIRLAGDPRVLTSETDGPLEPAETRQQSTGFDDGNGSAQTYAGQPIAQVLHLEIAHTISAGAGVKVAILDTGADLAHPALAGRIAGGYDFVDHDADPDDIQTGTDTDGDGSIDEGYGHGTHVAGIVALTAPGAQLLIARVLDSNGRGDMLSVAAGVRWAIANGARVINLSLGSLRHSDAVQNALAEAEVRGIVCVVSAGNWGAEQPVEFPASSTHAIAVAAIDPADHAASFTSFGSFVDLSAPGVSVRSAYPGGRYRLWSGTSMAAPFVSGAAALLIALHPEWTTNEVQSRLDTTSQSLLAANPVIGNRLGAGGLDVLGALMPDRGPTGGGGGGHPIEVL